MEVSDGFPPLDEIMVDTYPATPVCGFGGTRSARVGCANQCEPVPRPVTDRYNNSY